MPTQTINLNDTTPAAPANADNVKWQADPPSLDPSVVRNVSAYVKAATSSARGTVKPDGATVLVAADGTTSVPVVTGDTGAGGKAGLVPAPAAGDAAAGKVLKADGAFHTPPLVIGFGVLNGSIGTAVTLPQTAPRAGQLTSCAVRVKTSDPATALTFSIKQNGVDVFDADPVVPASTAANTLISLTNLTSSPLTVNKNDMFTLDISSGSSAWQFTAQLES